MRGHRRTLGGRPASGHVTGVAQDQREAPALEILDEWALVPKARLGELLHLVRLVDDRPSFECQQCHVLVGQDETRGLRDLAAQPVEPDRAARRLHVQLRRLYG